MKMVLLTFLKNLETNITLKKLWGSNTNFFVVCYFFKKVV
jgi:hypothetical protein